MIRRKAFALAELLCLMLAAAVLQAQDRLRAGIWENTVTSNGQSATRSHCISALETEQSNGAESSIRASIEKALAKGGKCQLKEFKIEGNTKTELLVCGSVTYFNQTTFHNGDTFETTTTRTESGIAKVTLIKGPRTGPCPS